MSASVRFDCVRLECHPAPAPVRFFSSPFLTTIPLSAHWEDLPGSTWCANPSGLFLSHHLGILTNGKGLSTWSSNTKFAIQYTDLHGSVCRVSPVSLSAFPPRRRGKSCQKELQRTFDWPGSHELSDLFRFHDPWIWTFAPFWNHSIPEACPIHQSQNFIQSPLIALHTGHPSGRPSHGPSRDA
jgi:hypothetical protein